MVHAFLLLFGVVWGTVICALFLSFSLNVWERMFPAAAIGLTSTPSVYLGARIWGENIALFI